MISGLADHVGDTFTAIWVLEDVLVFPTWWRSARPAGDASENSVVDGPCSLPAQRDDRPRAQVGNAVFFIIAGSVTILDTFPAPA